MHVVVIFDHAYVSGGQAKVAMESAIGLAGRGHDVTYFAAAGPADPSLEAGGVEVITLGQRDILSSPRLVGAVQGIWNLKARRELSRLLARCPKGDTVVHLHGWAKALSPSIAGPIAASGHPAIYTLHEYFLACPNGGLFNYQENRPCGLEPLSAACLRTNCDSRSYPQKVWRVARHGVMAGLARLPTIFSDILYLTEFQLAAMRPFLPKGPRLHQVSNPISARDLGRKPDPASGEIIFAGRLSVEKGVLLFAEAARRAGIIPVFVGDGPAAKDLAARYPEARMLGWHDGPAMADRLRAARAMVFPSIWYEGQPLVILEALALGTPVVVSDGCAGREAIRDGETGLWFRSNDVDHLAQRLRAMADDATVTRMSNRAYETYWAAPLTVGMHLDRLETVYGGALAAPDTARHDVRPFAPLPAAGLKP